VFLAVCPICARQVVHVFWPRPLNSKGTRHAAPPRPCWAQSLTLLTRPWGSSPRFSFYLGLSSVTFLFFSSSVRLHSLSSPSVCVTALSGFTAAAALPLPRSPVRSPILTTQGRIPSQTLFDRRLFSSRSLYPLSYLSAASRRQSSKRNKNQTKSNIQKKKHHSKDINYCINQHPFPDPLIIPGIHRTLRLFLVVRR
jgi:hypothetical protein